MPETWYVFQKCEGEWELVSRGPKHYCESVAEELKSAGYLVSVSDYWF